MSETDRAFLGYKLALGIGLVAGVIQILFGLLRAGRLADFFPLTPVHGMLASIGIIIIAKQAYEVIGVAPTKGVGPLELIAEFPGKLRGINPEIAIIGLTGNQEPRDDVEKFCAFAGIDSERFFAIAEGFRNYDVWKREAGKWVIPGFIVPDWEWK